MQISTSKGWYPDIKDFKKAIRKLQATRQKDGHGYINRQFTEMEIQMAYKPFGNQRNASKTRKQLFVSMILTHMRKA